MVRVHFQILYLLLTHSFPLISMTIFKYSFILVTPDCLSSAMASFLNLSYISAASLRSRLDEKHQKTSMSKLAFTSPSWLNMPFP